MRVEPTAIAGVVRILAEAHPDERGFFARTYCRETFAAAGLAFGAVRQTSVSWNPRRGTLRGMHWQDVAKPEGKLVRVAAGRIFDVAVDLRRDSPSFRRWVGIELDAAGQGSLLIAPGCAHGFVTLDDETRVEYAMDADYDAALARGVRWNDPAFAIEWPLAPTVISPRDAAWPDFTP